MSQHRTLLSIQHLRGIAALGVAAHHTYWTKTSLGAAGVDLFFIISGVIMTYVCRPDQTPLGFLQARALRVVPLYWAVTLLTAAIRQTDGASHIIQSLLFLPHTGPHRAGYPVVVVGWTLVFETFFYAIFATTLLLAPIYRLAALTVTLVAVGVSGAILYPDVLSPTTVISPLLLEFLFGILLCKAWQRGWLRAAAAPLLLVGLALLGAQVGLAKEPTTWRWLLWGGPALLIVAGALGIERAGWLPRVPALLTLGNTSYALYLTHFMLLDFIRPMLLPFPALVALPVAVVACVVVGWLTHQYVELPLGHWLARRAPGPAWAN